MATITTTDLMVDLLSNLMLVPEHLAKAVAELLLRRGWTLEVMFGPDVYKAVDIAVADISGVPWTCPRCFGYATWYPLNPAECRIQCPDCER